MPKHYMDVTYIIYLLPIQHFKLVPIFSMIEKSCDNDSLSTSLIIFLQ